MFVTNTPYFVRRGGIVLCNGVVLFGDVGCALGGEDCIWSKAWRSAEESYAGKKKRRGCTDVCLKLIKRIVRGY